MGEPKAKAETAIEKDPQEDIDQIMNEIESLQKEMTSVDVKAEASTDPLEAVPEAIVEAPAPEETQVVEEAPVVEETPVAEVIAEAPEDSGMAEFRGGESDVSMEETLGTLKEEEPASGKSLLDEVPTEETYASAEGEEMAVETPEEEQVMESPEESSYSEGEGSLSMTLTGKMTLKLRYEYEGEDVVIGFSDHALKVQLSDGTEFKIPVNRPKRKIRTLKRVA